MHLALEVSTTPKLFQWEWISIELPKIGILAVVSHIIATVVLARRWHLWSRLNLMLCVTACCALGALLPTAIFYKQTMTQWGEFYASGRVLFAAEFLAHFTILAMWSGFFLAFQFHELNRRTQIDRARMLSVSKEAELALLKSQINPHFLFNSLNLLRALIQQEPATARQAVTHLSEMMRHSLFFSHNDTIPLNNEVDFVESYLELQKLRYEQRLRISAKIPAENRSLHIPSMLLHTLVDNAVKHGIDQRIDGVDISYTIQLEGDFLTATVTNSGRLLDNTASTGTGLANLRERLGLLYGDRAHFDITEEGGLVTAKASWPATTQPSPQ